MPLTHKELEKFFGTISRSGVMPANFHFSFDFLPGPVIVGFLMFQVSNIAFEAWNAALEA